MIESFKEAYRAITEEIRRTAEALQAAASASGERRVELPAEEEAVARLRRLRKCESAWKGVPALYVEKPNLIAIVFVRETIPTEEGFRLVVDIDEWLTAPEETKHKRTLSLGCGWNSSYVSFHERCVSALLCFRLEFGHDAISRVRRYWAALPADKARVKDLLLTGLNYCFAVGRPYGPSEGDFEKWLDGIARVK